MRDKHFSANSFFDVTVVPECPGHLECNFGYLKNRNIFKQISFKNTVSFGGIFFDFIFSLCYPKRV